MSRTNGNGQYPPTATLPATVPDQLQPHNVEAEEAVLGSLLIDPDAIIQISTFLKQCDFYVEKHGWVYEAIYSLHERHEPADLVTLSDELTLRGQLDEIGGTPRLSDLISATPTAIHVEYYARIIERTAILRRVISAAGQIARLAYTDTEEVSEVVEQAEQIIFSCSTNNNSNGTQHVGSALNKYYDRIEYIKNNPGAILGIPSGLTDLDKMLGGFHKTNLILLAGRPGHGKTSLALNIALHAAKHSGARVGFFSLEMSDEELIQRLIACECGIDSFRLSMGDIREDEWGKFTEATRLIDSLPIFINDTPAISPLQLRGEARRMKAQHGLDLLIVDYLQLMQSDRKIENRTQEVSYISSSLKALAKSKELRIPVIALSQLSRDCEKRGDKRPIPSDLRDSGSLEQDADIIIFTYSDSEYNPDTEFPNMTDLSVSKHRLGPKGIIRVYFDKSKNRFRDMTSQSAPYEQIPDNIERQYAGDR